MNEKKKLYTLITGASTGLGKQFANECAMRKMNLILVSLPNEGLAEIAEKIIKEYNIDCEYYETDLTKNNAVYELHKWVSSKFSINMLINNAGLGGSLPFENIGIRHVDEIILLNVRATSLLCRLFIPELKKYHNSYILNVSSIAGFGPVPFKTVYAASKGYIYSFSRGLKEELRNTPIKVSVIHPGPIMTNPEAIERILRQGFFGKIALLPIDKVAKIAISSLLNGKSFIIPGFFNKLSFFLVRIIPTNMRLYILGKLISREFKGKKKE